MNWKYGLTVWLEWRDVLGDDLTHKELRGAISIVRAYVINLARSPDRRAHITAELKKTGLDYEITTAVDGRDLDLQDTTIVDPSLPARTQFLASTAGAALSHLNVCRKIIEDGLDEALVLEDDVNLPADLGSLADAVADQLTGAEVALLSYESPDPPCKMSREGSVQLPSSRLLALPIDIRQLTSGGAYIITRAACERMVKFVLPVRVNPDDWWFFYREGVLDRVQCVVPLPVLKNPKLTSTVGSYSLGNGVRARLVWPLVRRKIPVLHQALSYRRQRIYRQWGRSEFIDIPFIEKPSRLE
jgi:glycosyl transferase family 25